MSKKFLTPELKEFISLLGDMGIKKGACIRGHIDKRIAKVISDIYPLYSGSSMLCANVEYVNGQRAIGYCITQDFFIQVDIEPEFSRYLFPVINNNECYLIVTDAGDPSVGIFPASWSIQCPFTKEDAKSDVEMRETFLTQVVGIYTEFCDGRISADYDFIIIQDNDE